MNASDRECRRRCLRMARALWGPGAGVSLPSAVDWPEAWGDALCDGTDAATWPALERKLRALCERRIKVLQKSMEGT